MSSLAFNSSDDDFISRPQLNQNTKDITNKKGTNVRNSENFNKIEDFLKSD